jgi:uncharacterized protein (TIGR03435 family)
MSLRRVTLALLLPLAFLPQLHAQGNPPVFDVTSVKPSGPDSPAHSNVPLGPGDTFSPVGGFFSAVNTPLSSYISFAYKIMASQAVFIWPQMPQWVKDSHYDIQGRAEGNPGKDEIRAMMRALLADRFKLTIHTEVRQVPLFLLVVATPGKTGPRLRVHPAGDPCPAEQGTDDGFPPKCGGIYGQTPSAPNHLRLGGRDVPMELITQSFPTLDLGRPVIDKTGLKGHYDFTIDWAPDSRDPREPGLAGIPDPSGLGFFESLKQQLGLRLEPQKGPIEVMIIDHIEHPSEN